MTAAVRISESLRDAVVEFVVAEGCVTSKLVAERFNRTRRTAQQILAALRDEKRIKGGRVQRGRHHPAVWTLIGQEQLGDQVKALLDAEEDDSAENRPGDGLPVVLQVAATAWRRGETHRDPMDAAFFGPAPAERIAA
jgi:hypothetical protein